MGQGSRDRVERPVAYSGTLKPTTVVPEGGAGESATKEGMELSKAPEGKDPEAGGEGEGDDDDDDDDDGPFDPMDIPDSPMGKVLWFIGLPLSVAFYLTIPDCRRERFKKFYLVHFFMCIFWIGILALVMVWVVDRFGKITPEPEYGIDHVNTRRNLSDMKFEVRYVHKKNWQEKLGMAAEGALERAFLKIWQRGQNGTNY